MQKKTMAALTLPLFNQLYTNNFNKFADYIRLLKKTNDKRTDTTSSKLINEL